MSIQCTVNNDIVPTSTGSRRKSHNEESIGGDQLVFLINNFFLKIEPIVNFDQIIIGTC